MKKDSLWGQITRYALIIAVIIVIGAALFGIVRLIPGLASPIISSGKSALSIFGDRTNLSVSINPKNVESGEEVILSWKHEGDVKEGSYSFYYDCRNDLKIEIVSGSRENLALCNEYTQVEKTNEVRFKPIFSRENSYTDANITFAFFENGNKNPTTKNTSLITVRSGNKIESGNLASSIKVENRETEKAGQVNQYPESTKADLIIQNLEAGTLSSTGKFESKKSFKTGEAIALQFEIWNIGSKKSDIWAFRVETPIPSIRTWNSGPQIILQSGEKTTFILKLSSTDKISGTIKITADPEDYIDEDRENNNSDSISINTSGIENNSGTNTGGSTSNLFPDLKVSIIDTGTMSRNNGIFDEGEISEDDRGAVKFMVENVGNAFSGNFVIRTYMPSDGITSYTSPLQSTLGPGQKREFTVGFDSPINGDFSVTVDPFNAIRETNENNNSTAEEIEVEN